MRQFTLGFITDSSGEQVLLGAKKRTNSGFTVALGKRNGAGGAVEEGETLEEGMVREIYEEAKIRIEKTLLAKVAHIQFSFEGKPEWNREVTVYLIPGYEGLFEETDEMRWQRRPKNALPWEQMRESDKQWLERVLSGEKVKATVVHTKEGNVVAIDFLEVDF